MSQEVRGVGEVVVTDLTNRVLGQDVVYPLVEAAVVLLEPLLGGRRLWAEAEVIVRLPRTWRLWRPGVRPPAPVPEQALGGHQVGWKLISETFSLIIRSLHLLKSL